MVDGLRKAGTEGTEIVQSNFDTRRERKNSTKNNQIPHHT